MCVEWKKKKLGRQRTWPVESRTLLEGLRKTTHILVNKDVISKAEIRTRRLSNTHQKHCHLSTLTRYI